MLSTLVNILLFILVVGFLTFIHELGHFLSAKIVGAKVYEFSLGFGPKLASKRYRETLYCIRIIPLGGFVKILGDGDPGEYEEKGDDLKESKYNLGNKSRLAQIFVMVAGVVMNLLFAMLFYYVILSFNGWRTNPIFTDLEDVKLIAVQREKVLGFGLLEGGNAEKAGLPEYGVIRKLNGDRVESRDSLIEMIKEKEEVELFVCEEMGSECDTYMVPVDEEGKIGVFISHGTILDYSNNKLLAGPLYMANNLKIVTRVVSSMVGVAKETGDYSDLSHTVSGPIGIFLLIDSLKSRGFLVFLSLIADLSLSLAIMNLLPIPALDGGRVLIITLEGMFRKEFDEKLKTVIINGSMILLVILIVLIIIKDIANIDVMRNMFQ